MHTRLIQQRGEPIYIPTHRGTISLVPEVAVREWRIAGESGPAIHAAPYYAVFVIDDQGVRRVALRDPRTTLVRAALVAFLVLLLVWVLTGVSRAGREPGGI